MAFKEDHSKVRPEKVYTYAPVNKLAKIIKGLFIGIIVFAALRLALDLWGVAFVEQAKSGVKVSQDEGQLLDALVGISALLQIVLHFVTGIFFLRWFYLLRRNMSALKVPYFFGHPLDVVGAYIIPIVNLYQPLINSQDIWRATDPELPSAAAWATAPSSPLITAWWWLWVGQNIGHQVAAFITRNSIREGASLQELSNVYLSSGAAECLSIAAAVLAMMVVVRMTDRQEKYQKVVAARVDQTQTPEAVAQLEASVQPETAAQPETQAQPADVLSEESQSEPPQQS